MALPQGFSLKALLENPELLNPPKINDEKKTNKEEKKVDNALDQLFNPQSAFLGPQIWGDDLKLEFMDLDDFLLETGLDDQKTVTNTTENAVVQQVNRPPTPTLQSLLESTVNPNTVTVPQMSPNLSSDDSTQGVNLNVDQVKVEYCRKVGPPSTSTASREETGSPTVELEFTEADLALATIPGQEGFDPRRKVFSEEELRPQPMIRKSRKVFVNEESKDDKYWARRKKNNVAAKRSRDARRVKENQIAMRASFLEKQNNKLQLDIEESRRENEELRRKLAKYER